MVKKLIEYRSTKEERERERVRVSERERERERKRERERERCGERKEERDSGSCHMSCDNSHILNIKSHHQ